ncbi:PA2778 family cysteine peptidase, partial [Ideonella sp.]|uniref:PA2778 family cysteine peptidase n=1 Tax=Ideonella sp. TaxID=1929293 RepID=UPI003BB5D39F
MPLTRRAVGQRIGAWAAAAALPGCASLDGLQTTRLQTSARRGQAPVDLSARVPLVPQDDTLCGPAALAMVLAASGTQVPLDQLTREVYLPGRQGSLQAEMLAGARRHGRVAHRLPPELDALWQELQAGSPVLVLLNLALPFWPRWHYAVVVGMDIQRRTALLHSGERAPSEWRLDTLEHTWARSGHWAMLALPPAQLPATAEEGRLVPDLLAYEKAQGAAGSLPGWRAARARHPDSMLLAMATANAAMAAGLTREAAEGYEAAAGLHDSAAAWNNLAVARARLGEPDAALSALLRAEECAHRREPAWLPAIAQTRRELF